MGRLLCLIVCSGFVAAFAAPVDAQAKPAAPARPDRAPRAYGVSVAGSYAFSSELPLGQGAESHRPVGVAVGGRSGWQVRGLAGGPPAWIGFETEFLYQDAHHARSSYALIYGIFAKHSFAQAMRVRPYFEYGLGAAQVWVSKVDGRGIGHSTRLGFGVDIRIGERVRVSVTARYQGILMPSFATAEQAAHSTNLHAASLATGFWFGS